MVRGDHFRISVTSNVRKHLEAAIEIAFAEEEPVTHYKVKPVSAGWGTDEKTPPALLLWRPWDGESAKGWTPLPYPLDAAKTARFAWDWLESAERGQGPDTDGSCEPDAFTVRGGHDADDGATVVVIPDWSVYGK